jgi:hypothetical protein
VLEAVHRFSGQRILPADARPGGGQYRCGCCDAPVVLVQAFTLHFRHEKYRARLDCENYVWSEYRYTGRPTRSSATRELDPDELSYVSFELTVDGPRIRIFFPAPSVSSAGHVELVERTVRRISLSDVGRGLHVSFPLSQATWAIRATDDVAEPYLAQLTLGRQYLELERNLFAASDSTGRQLNERSTVRLGDALWWIGRADIRVSESVPQLVEVKLASVDQGWYVFLVQLPEKCEADESQVISRWLQRRIQPQRARAWVESPFPRARRSDGLFVYSAKDGQVICAAEQPVTFQIFDAAGVEVVASEGANTVSIPPLIFGEISIYVDGVRMLRLDRCADAPPAKPSVLARIQSGMWTSFLAMQEAIDRLIASGAASANSEIRWWPPSLGSLLKGSVHPTTKTAIELAAVLTPGAAIDFDKLGDVSWPSRVSSDDSDKAVPGTRLPDLPLFLWLASMGSRLSLQPRGLRLRPSADAQRRYPLLRRLSAQTWPARYSAQVKHAERVLETLR